MVNPSSTANPVYPEKVLKIYQAVIQFFCSGSDLTSIKITDIAQSAEIGKGTVYEYFHSKEEMFLKSLIYAVEVIIEKISRITERKSSFKDRLYAILQYLLDNQTERIALVRALTQKQVFSDEMHTLLREECNRIDGLLDSCRNQLRGLLHDAVKEQVIPELPNDFYWQMVLHGAISGLIFDQRPPSGSGSGSSLSQQEIMDNVYTLVVRSLQM